MTKEQIATLQSLMADRVYVGYDTIKRLIDEREALLSAFRAYTLIVEGPTPNKTEAVAAYEALCAAVAKVEAPQE